MFVSYIYSKFKSPKNQTKPNAHCSAQETSFLSLYTRIPFPYFYQEPDQVSSTSTYVYVQFESQLGIISNHAMGHKNKKKMTLAARLTNHVLPLVTKSTLNLLPKRVTPASCWTAHSDEPAQEATMSVPGPGDVREGHFTVLAAASSTGSDDDGEMQRFVIGLNQLRNPSFLKLLDQAKEEYGFPNDGVLVVPCKAEELRKILSDRL